MFIWWSQNSKNMELRDEIEDYKEQLRDLRTRSIASDVAPFQFIESDRHDSGLNYYISVPVLMLDPFTRNLILAPEIY
jgi:hypothetical protein